MSFLRIIALAFAVLALAGCALNGGPATYLVAETGPYLLDSGDVVRVTVYGDPELSSTYRIDDSGAIALPLVGAVQARGLTTELAAARVTSALASGFMRSPNVAVEVAEYRPYFLQGAVRNSGQFTYVYGMTVRAAISAAGGHTETANRSNAVIYRRQSNEMTRGTVGLDFPLLPGDTIVISERWF